MGVPDYGHGGLCVQAIDVMLDPIGLSWRPLLLLVFSRSAWPAVLCLWIYRYSLPRIPAPGIFAFTPFGRPQGSGLLTTPARHPTSFRTSHNDTSSMWFLFSFFRPFGIVVTLCFSRNPCAHKSYTLAPTSNLGVLPTYSPTLA